MVPDVSVDITEGKQYYIMHVNTAYLVHAHAAHLPAILRLPSLQLRLHLRNSKPHHRPNIDSQMMFKLVPHVVLHGSYARCDAK